MKNRIIFLCLSVIFFTIHVVNAQVGINTEEPQATLHIKKAPSSSTTPNGLLLPYVTVADLNAQADLYTENQDGILVIITDIVGAAGKTSEVVDPGIYYYKASVSKWLQINLPSSVNNANIYNSDGSLDTNRSVGLNGHNLSFNGTGNVGIGVATPTNKLHVDATSNPLKLGGVQTGVVSTDKLMVLDETGVVKNIGTVSDMVDDVSIPTPALFVLQNNINNFLKGVSMGKEQYIPMTVVKNAIPGLTVGSDGFTIKFPPGTYQITFIYEANYDKETGAGADSDNEIYVSSYFIDFPAADGGDVRIHSTDAHMSGDFSNHGSEVTYVVTFDSDMEWKIGLGYGQSGNSNPEGGGLNLKANSTELVIYRMGD